jgi:O-methyltransferase
MKALLKRILPPFVQNAVRYRKVDLREYHVLPKKDITYSNDLLFTYHNADFQQEPRFAEAYRLCKEIGGGLLKDYDIQWRVHVLCWAAAHGAKLEGDFVDCGVHTGFCTRAIVHYTDFGRLGKRYWLLDTFQGLDPKYSTAYELERNTKLGYSRTVDLYSQVQRTFAGYNVELVKGPIPETLAMANPEKVAFLSIDMNTAAPEVAAMEHFWPRMSSGSMIVLDDYGYPGCLNQKLAHDDWARSKGVQVLSLPTCQGLIIKP